VKVREAIEALKDLPGDSVICDEYAEYTLTRFYTSSYGTQWGEHPCVMFDTEDLPDP
jgi:hypothetical protein